MADTEDLRRQVAQLTRSLLEAECEKAQAFREADEATRGVEALEKQLQEKDRERERALAIASAKAEAQAFAMEERFTARIEELEYRLQEKPTTSGGHEGVGNEGAVQLLAERDKLILEADTLRARYAALEADHEELQLQAEQAVASHATLAADHQQLSQLVTEQRAMADEFASMRAEVERLRDERARIDEDFAAVQQEAAARAASSGDHGRERAAARAEIRSLQAELAVLRDEKSQVEQALAQAEAQMGAQFASAARQGQDHHSAIAAEVDKLLAENETLQSEVERLVATSRQVDVDGLRMRLSELQQEVAQAEVVKTALQAEASFAKEERMALDEILKTQVQEVERLTKCYDELQMDHGRLAMRARMETEKTENVAALKDEIAGLRKERESMAVENHAQDQELRELRAKIDDLSAALRCAQVEVEEMRRLGEQHAAERGTLDAEASRLRAENAVLAEETRDLIVRLQDAETRMASVPASHALERSHEFGALAVAAAEQWVLGRAALPLERNPSIIYPGGCSLDFPEVGRGPLAATASANAKHRPRLATALENGDAARVALQTFQTQDSAGRGFLEWPGNEIIDFVEAVFHQYGLVPPPEAEVQDLLRSFHEDIWSSRRLEARGCVCFADALLRCVFFLPGAGGEDDARSAASPGMDLQERLRRRLEDAERAAERALARASAAAASSVSVPRAAPRSPPQPLAAFPEPTAPRVLLSAAASTAPAAAVAPYAAVAAAGAPYASATVAGPICGGCGSAPAGVRPLPAPHLAAEPKAQGVPLDPRRVIRGPMAVPAASPTPVVVMPEPAVQRFPPSGAAVVGVARM